MENIAAKIGLELQPAVIGQRFRTYINLKLAVIGCPLLRAILHIMRDGNFEGSGLNDPDMRELFDPERALASDWYQARLESTAAVDQELWSRHVKNLEAFIRRPGNEETSQHLRLHARLDAAMEKLRETRLPGYAESLLGAIGNQPIPG